MKDESQKEWSNGIREQLKNQAHFFGYNNLEEAKKYWDIEYIIKEFEKQEVDYPCYKKGKLTIAWLESSSTSKEGEK